MGVVVGEGVAVDDVVGEGACENEVVGAGVGVGVEMVAVDILLAIK